MSEKISLDSSDSLDDFKFVFLREACIQEGYISMFFLILLYGAQR